MTDMNSLFEEDAGALVVKNEDLSSVGALAKRAKELEKEIEDMNLVLKERQDQYRKLLEETIPAMLAELGMKSFKMSDGSLIDVKPFGNVLAALVHVYDIFDFVGFCRIQTDNPWFQLIVGSGRCGFDHILVVGVNTWAHRATNESLCFSNVRFLNQLIKCGGQELFVSISLKNFRKKIYTTNCCH
jgi:hypothetical protein